MTVGPADPLVKGRRDVLSPNVIRQWYEDGCIYQISIRRGSALKVFNAHTWILPGEHYDRAEWLTVHEPLDWADDDENVYVSLWVSNG